MPVTIPVEYPIGRPKGFPIELTIDVDKASQITHALAKEAMEKEVGRLGIHPPLIYMFCYYVPSDE